MNPERNLPLTVQISRYLTWMRTQNYSERTVENRESYLSFFIAWCEARSIARPQEVTKPILEHYQRWLFHYRKTPGKPLTFASQRERLQKIRGFYKWLARQNAIPSNPASELDLPRVERRIPRAILSEREIDKVLALPDLSEPLGGRDRAAARSRMPEKALRSPGRRRR